MRIWSRSLLTKIIKLSAFFYLTPSNLNYWWNFGIFALFFLIVQLFTGITLAMFYNPSAIFAYSVVMYLNNEVYYGWWLRSLHANGASFFFLSIFLHMFRSLYHGGFTYPKHLLWVSGILIFLLMIIIAFLGYVLPWGQMSFWGAMVITSLLAVVPLIGNDLIYLLRGGFSIQDSSLHRFYALHFAISFVLLFMVIVHLLFLHEQGSSNPLGVPLPKDNIPFSPYPILKDLFALLLIGFFFIYIINKFPDILGHSINFEKANFLVTPAHIVPEWYLLFFYAILRSITNKFLGFFFTIFAILILFSLPFLSKLQIIQSNSFKPFSAIFFWIFFNVCVILAWIGSLPVMDPFLNIGQNFTLFYFGFFFCIIPLLGVFDFFSYNVYKKKWVK